MTNWDLLGHEWAVDLLRQHVARGESRHAYLFLGSPGIGRKTLAMKFAKALNCSQPVAPGEPCGTCKDCRGFESRQHPDLVILEPAGSRNMIKVKDFRDSRFSLSLRPYQARYKILFLPAFDESHKLASSPNAILKTLEEPPPCVIALVTADNAEQLLPTIVSRCEIIRLRPLPIDAVEAFLIQKGQPAESARLLAHVSQGRPGYALRLAADPEALAERSARLEDLLRLLGAPRRERFAYAESLAKDKDALRPTLLLWLSFWRDVLLRVSAAEGDPANLDRAAAIDAQAGRLSLADARRIVSAHERALAQLEANVNARLATEVLLLDL